MASKFDPTVLIGAALGAATIVLGKPKEPITPAQVLGNMCAAFAFGVFAPDLVRTYYPTAENFLGLVAFVFAVVGVGLTTRLIQRVPALFDKWLSKKGDEFTESK